MSSTNPTQGVSDPAQGKGKGKANDPPHDVSMGEEDSSSDEETGAEDETKEEPEEEDEDNMEEIDTDNIITDGRRTRGKSIDFAKAAENAGDELDDDDDDEDDDFEEKDEDDHEMKD
ncbi:histone chaperone domain CHZ-domain-containing protein [Usnea florida]